MAIAIVCGGRDYRWGADYCDTVPAAAVGGVKHGRANFSVGMQAGHRCARRC
jgi:hypothetical protein